jgi:copper(I)-binding protein
MKIALAQALALALAALGPVACGEAEQPVAAGAQAPEGVKVANARMSLPAVKGNPAAVYFDITNGGSRDVFIRTGSVEGAGMGMLHQMSTWSGKADMQEVTQQPVRAGETLKFEPATMHLMISDVTDKLAPGGTAQVTLVFVGGKKVTFPAKILSAGEER